MNKTIIALALATMPCYADLGILDNPIEIQAKTGASGLGITQIYDHPNQISNGQFYVPITYNGNNGAESDPHLSNSDIDYVSLSQIKGLTGAVGATGIQGIAGTNGSKGDIGSQGIQGAQGVKGDKGDKGDKGNKGDTGAEGKPGDDMKNRLTVNVGAEVRWYDWKHVSLISGYRYDVNHNGHTVDAMVIQLKLGKSYEDRKLEKMQKELDKMQHFLTNENNVINARSERIYQ